MIKINYNIRIFTFLFLLLLGGMGSEAWATVTYHIMTKPFDVEKADGSTKWDDVRVEALRCTSDAATVGLPAAFQSPLATNFRYYRNVTCSHPNTKLYDNDTQSKILPTRYDIYEDTDITSATLISSPASTATIADEHIYVIYDYVGSNDILKLDGGTYYNVQLNTGDKMRYFCFNRDRGNRPAAALATTVTAANLVSDDFVSNVNGFNGTKNVHFQFKFYGEDPYNITIMTGYEGNLTYSEDLEIEKNTKYKKTYRYSTIFAKLQNNNNNDGTANMWLAPDDHRHYNSTSVVSYDDWDGFYRGNMNPIFNAVAILPHNSGSGYVFVASKLNQNNTVYQPNGSKNYAYLTDDGNNPRMIFKAANSAVVVEPKEIRTYTFNVTTKFGNTVSATAKWSDAYINAEIETAHVPASLQRKYCSYVGFYKDAALTQAITKYSDVPSDGNIYVKYEVSGAPFTAISPSANYTTATWYELTDKDSSKKKIRWDSSSNVFKNNGAESPNPDYEKVSEFAFMGDPYELRIIHRSLSESASANQYLGSSSSPSAETRLSYGSARDVAGFKWEIPYDNDAKVNTFELKQFNTDNAYWQWNSSVAGSEIFYNTTSTRVKVMELPNLTYTYNIVDRAGTIAIKATAVLPVFTKLTGYTNIPTTIRSPFLADEEITFYSDAACSSSMTEVPATANADIYVKYTVGNLASKNIKLSDAQTFNVKLNDEYIYWDATAGKILSNKTPDDLSSDVYLWYLEGQDPYSMKIRNKGKNQYVKVTGGTWGDDKALEFDAAIGNASRFIAMMGSYIGVYEVLAATGTTDLCHIGRASTTGAETRIYSVATYAHGTDQLRFELSGTTVITYTLVDKAKNELFTVTSNNPRLALPSEYQSPLVDTYYYYPTKAKAITDNHTDNITEIAEDDDNDAADDNHVWVTYTVNDNVVFNTSSSTKNNPYLLRFHKGKSYRLEDGSDKLTTGDKIQAMYPYCNGDGNLNIYGEDMRDEQMEGGTSTRPRWQWFFESANSDPYHVKIHSNNQITTPIGKDYTYFNTYAVHFNQDTGYDANKQRVVTGATLPGVGNAATEYMILGTVGNYKLLTTATVAVDLNGDGDTDDDGENVRQYVKSFEQYWKTYNMIKQHLLGLGESTDAFSEDPSTFVMPSAKWADLKTALDAKSINDAEDLNYVDGCSWHSYSIVANATRWNGYNNTESGHKSKVVEELEHWFQTFDMGDGTFTLENGDIPPVLVLLDRHGWEIMRKPIPMGTSDADAETKLAALKVYDSPMVKEYKFYSQATKASGCHKYSLRLNDDGSERDAIGFTSTSLGTLPAYKSGRDLFVTYTVKEEYENSYVPSTSIASKFIVLQNHQYAKDASSTLTAVAASSSISNEIIADASKEGASKTFKQECLWYVQPNSDIDTEMGYPGDPITTYTDTENGFDPYNVQFKNVSTNMFFTIDMKKSVLSGGVYTGDYTGGTQNVTLAAKNTSPVASTESYDHSTLQMTNQTFMAVQDENGNMQLMPRFDHSHRINAFTTLEDPLTHAKADVDDASPGEQTTFLVRPQVFDYRIIDNQGRVALHYQTGGEFYPSIPEHFMSPLATDFAFYKGLTPTAGVYDLSGVVESNEITSSFAAADIQNDQNDIFIRYRYNVDYDIENDNILQGQWVTMSLGGKDVQADGTVGADGTGVSLYTGSKDATVKKWQWKFLQSPFASSSSLYNDPDPYAVEIYNRDANNDDPTADNSKMSIPIKISSKNRFVLLNHPDGDYALAAAGDETTYSFLNGGSMTASDAVPPVAASVEEEGSFTTTSDDISDDARIILTEDVTHIYTYYIITHDINGSGHRLAASDTQNLATAQSNSYKPVVPESIQSPLIRDNDYTFYGTAPVLGGVYTIDDKFAIDNLYGLYDDDVYVRYPAFDRDVTPYMVPNVKGDDGAGHVAKGSGSNDVAIDISGNIPYNIVWFDNNMMQSTDGDAISDGGNHALDGSNDYIWKFEGSDPYNLQIRHKSDGKYVDGTATLNATAKNFMLLKKDGYDYGVLAETGNQGTMLTFSGSPKTLTTTTSDPAKFIIFALSVHRLIYHLVINTTGSNTSIPYRAGGETTLPVNDLGTETIPGTTQRNLTSGSPAGATYQLGNTIYFKDGESTTSKTYCYDAGEVSIGDVLEVPSVLKRPNCKYYYYVQDIYDTFNSVYDASTDASTGGTDERCEGLNTTLNDKYKGLKIEKLISKSDVIGKTIVINITYSFNTELTETNSGDGFVTDVNQNLWYTFETSGATPYLAHYTNAWGLQGMAGRATRYTNDYLWLPLGDPYGFKMYNRYMKKNLDSSGDVNTYVITTDNADFSSAEGEDVIMAVPGTGGIPSGNEVYELLAGSTDGYFYVHPVINNGSTKYYLKHDSGDDNKVKLSTTPTEWTFGLSSTLLQPYFERVGYVGGLTTTAYENMDESLVTAIKDGTATAAQLMTAQSVVYNTANIVEFTSGYYRLHSQTGVSGISPVRYASGYLHDIEKTAVSGGIPMHFYSKKGVNTTFGGEDGLGSGFTVSNATQGDIPIPATEYDPSTIFYISGSTATNKTFSTATMSTQGLNVNLNKMTTSTGPTFTLMDIGGAVFLIHDGAEAASRKYLNFDQTSDVYDLKCSHDISTDDAKWCIEPANNAGLMLTLNSGGDGYYYATFCAPFDVTLPSTATAYVCTTWNTEIIHPQSIGQTINAGTPAIIRSTAAGRVQMTLPGTASSPTSCVFTGKYLEQLLDEITADDKVYTFGLPITGYNLVITPHDGFTNGEVDNVLSGSEPAYTGVGFYLNATLNKEKDATSGRWLPNNRYVLHNKIYYRTGSSGASAREDALAPQFVPVVFNDGEEGEKEDEELQPDGSRQLMVGDGCVYDLQGRKVATSEQVLDGTWRQRVASGIYIINGRKIKR